MSAQAQRQAVQMPPRAEYRPDFHRIAPGTVVHGLKLLYYVPGKSGKRKGWRGTRAFWQCMCCGATFVYRVFPIEHDRWTCVGADCNRQWLKKINTDEGNARNV